MESPVTDTSTSARLPVPARECYFSAIYDPSRQIIDYTSTVSTLDPFVPPTAGLDHVKITQEEIRELCKHAIGELSKAVLSSKGGDETKNDIDRLRGPGAYLSLRLLSSKARHFLQNSLKQYDSVMVVTNLPCIPWEMCHLGEANEGGGFPMEIGNLSRRLHVTPSLHEFLQDRLSEAGPDDDPPQQEAVLIAGKGVFSEKERAVAEDVFSPIGLYPPKELGSAEEFCSCIKSSRRTYFIGHRDPEGIPLADDIYLREDDVLAYSLGYRTFELFASCYASTCFQCIAKDRIETPSSCILSNPVVFPLAVLVAEKYDSVCLGPIGELKSASAIEILSRLEGIIVSGKPRTLGEAWTMVKKMCHDHFWMFMALIGSWSVPVIRFDKEGDHDSPD